MNNLNTKYIRYKGKLIKKDKWILDDGTILFGYPPFKDRNNIKDYTAQKSYEYSLNTKMIKGQEYADPKDMTLKYYNDYLYKYNKKEILKYCINMLKHFKEVLIVCDYFGIDPINCNNKIIYFKEIIRIVNKYK